MSNVIAAAPGFYVLGFYWDEEICDLDVSKAPIIGWVVDEDYPRHPMPLIPKGVADDWEYLLMPNGDVCDMYRNSHIYSDWFDNQRAKSKYKAEKIAKGVAA